jgi:hypothetical protein
VLLRCCRPILLLIAFSVPVSAQTAEIVGIVRDQSGLFLPGASVELRSAAGRVRVTATDDRGTYRFRDVDPGQGVLSFTLINFAGTRRQVEVPASGAATARMDTGAPWRQRL